jgi:flagellar biosynthesis chaperone FliJ
MNSEIITIHIDENFHIKIDNFQNHTLYRRRIVLEGKKVGKEYYEVVGYYSNTANAFKAYLQDVVVSERSVLNIEGYIKHLEETIEKVYKALDGIGERIEYKIKENKK